MGRSNFLIYPDFLIEHEGSLIVANIGRYISISRGSIIKFSCRSDCLRYLFLEGARLVIQSLASMV